MSLCRCCFYFCCGSEGHCTSESERGQFSIFGAIEEKSGQGLCRMNMGQEESWKRAVKLCGAMVFSSVLFGNENLATPAAGISTDGAQEMQKAEMASLRDL
jgi:hypothetical protein